MSTHTSRTHAAACSTPIPCSMVRAPARASRRAADAVKVLRLDEVHHRGPAVTSSRMLRRARIHVPAMHSNITPERSSRWRPPDADRRRGRSVDGAHVWRGPSIARRSPCPRRATCRKSLLHVVHRRRVARAGRPITHDGFNSRNRRRRPCGRRRAGDEAMPRRLLGSRIIAAMRPRRLDAPFGRDLVRHEREADPIAPWNSGTILIPLMRHNLVALADFAQLRQIARPLITITASMRWR